MAVGFKLALSVALVLVADFVANPPGGVEAVSLSPGSSDPSGDLTSPNVHDDQPTPFDQDQIEMLQDRIAKLQSDVSDIVQSCSPSMMAKLNNDRSDGERDGSRSRRHADTLPAEAPSSSNEGTAAVYYGGPIFAGQCFRCPAGTPGPSGPSGPIGQPGRDGRDGRDASLTPPAPTGTPATCTGSPSEPSTTPSPPPGNTPGGAVYTRWGKSECADGAELIYSGTIGGAHYTNTGGGSNYLCLPDEPIYDEVDGVDPRTYRAYLYSSEYQTISSPGGMSSVAELTPVCTVCRAPLRTSVLMVPARNVCPSDAWQLEYAGYLMAERHNHRSTAEFICVDRSLEFKEGTDGDQNGVLLYHVEGRVVAGGGLPSRYVDGYEITCAVCTM